MADAQVEHILDNPNALPNVQAESRPSISFHAILEKIQERLDSERVNFLNIDFLFILFIATLTDALDILHLTGIGIIITTIIDIIVFFVMFLWMHWRGKRIEDAKEEARQVLEEYTRGGGEAKRKVRIARTVYRRTALRRLLMRTLRRVGLVAIAEAVPLLGMVPWWTILVILSLREKVELEN